MASLLWILTNMLRVNKLEKSSRTVLIIEGRLTKEYVDVVERCCNEAMSAGRIVQLFLRHVSGVDDAGRALLSRMAGKGVQLRASGVYTSHLVKGLAAPSEGSPNSS